MGSVAMRKPVTITLVGVMLLSLFVHFGGVVEEAGGAVTYNSISNTIIVTGSGNNLASINTAINNQSIFWYDDSTFANYSTNANILVENGAILNFYGGDVLKFNKNTTNDLNLEIKGRINCVGVGPSNRIIMTSNESSPSPGDWEGIKLDSTEPENSTINFLVISYSKNGMNFISSSPVVQNTIISDSQSNGILCDGASPVLSNTELNNNGNGSRLISSQPIFENSSFLNNNRDIYMYSDSHPISLNSTFSFGKIFFDDINSELTVKWHLHILVWDNISNDPIQDATVTIEDVFDNPIPGSPFLSDTQGRIDWIHVTEYIRSNSGITDHTPHNITASHEEYYTGYTEPEPHIRSSMQVQVNLTMIRRDLTTNNENITFSPLPNGIPIAGEPLNVFAKIHNIEEDDAHDVRVIMEDDAPEGLNEILNISFSSIEGDTYKLAISQFEPTPGFHTINVRIDPFNEISEINSNILIDAETNNEAAPSISVNARPIANVSFPVNNAEINESTTIDGTSWDDPADNVAGLPGNDIININITLEGYDWIILNQPFQLNISTGGWDWTYDWDDTTKWNGEDVPDGNYTLQVKAWDGYHESIIYEVPISVNNTGANEAPTAVINEPLDGSDFSVNETIRFNGTQSSDPNGDPLTYEWEFGDGTFGAGNVTFHFYSRKGTYLVNLTVNDTQVSNSTQITVDITNTPPDAQVTSSTNTEFVNETITFFGYNSTDVETPGSLWYQWDYDASVDSDGDLNFTNDKNYESTTPNSTYSYPDPGTYTITLTVFDGEASDFDSVSVTIEPNAAPVAIIDSPSPFDQFSVNESIFFNASSSSDQNDPDLLYKWQFGDGFETGWLTTPFYNHSYSKTGPFPLFQYEVNLSVSDGSLITNTTLFIVVDNHMPVAILKSNLSESLTLFDITFWGNESYDPDEGNTLPDPPANSIENYTWEFGDGTIYTELTGNAPDGAFDGMTTHQYSDDGTYMVNLTVTDSSNTENPATDTTSITITIINRAPVIVNASADPWTPAKGEAVLFNVTVSDSDGSVIKYEWNFGSGYEDHTATLGNTTHSFGDKGKQTVRIRITDDDNEVTLEIINVTVQNTPPDVLITNPDDGEIVADIVSIEGLADDSDGDDISKVEVRIDDGVWEPASGGSSWSFSWDTSNVYNGQYTIYVRAFDADDPTDPPVSIVVDVQNAKTGIELTENLDPTTVEGGGTVTVWGTAIYNTGEPVGGGDIDITIISEDGNWQTETDENGEYSTNITAPLDASQYWIKVSISKGSFSKSTQERLTVQTPSEQPDLAISSSNIILNKNKPYSGETVSISVEVRNIGSGEATFVTVAAYYGDPATTGQSITPDSTKTINSIGAGQSGFVTMSWDTTGITGSYDVYIVLDPSNSISESDENNNKASTPITISGRPDFTIDSDDIKFSNDNPTVDDTISIFITIHNIGSVSESVDYEVFDGFPDSDGVEIESGEETIQEDDEKRIIITWTPDTSGEHVIFVRLSTRAGLDEEDDTNNEASSTITVEKKPAGGDGSSTIPILIIIVVIVVVLILFFLYQRGGEREKPHKEIPSATVISQAKVVEPKERKEEDLRMDGQGGMRI